MNGSIDYLDGLNPPPPESKLRTPVCYSAVGAPTYHPAEASLFTRQAQTNGFDQAALEQASYLLVGAGGLNSWVALALARSGAKKLFILDPDSVDRTNLHRQLFYPADLGKEKAFCLAQNLVQHATNAAQITGIPLRLEEAVEEYLLPADIMIVGVDRNDCRLFASRLARQLHIPAIFSMLSRDAQRVHCFSQGPDDYDACLWCALPNLDPENSMACVPSLISSCMLATAYTIYFIHRALMGWPKGAELFNWREADLTGVAPDRIGQIYRRSDCHVCAA